MTKTKILMSIMVVAAVAVTMVMLTGQITASSGGTASLDKLTAGGVNVSSDRQQTCPVEAVWGQDPSDPADLTWSIATSEVGPGYVVYENFPAVAGISGLRFWGLSLFNDGSWWDCTEDPMPFIITFYDDDGMGLPGTAVGTQNMSLIRIGTGELFAGAYELFEWNATISPAPAFSTANGWVSIQGTGDPDCWFLWASSTLGMDNQSYQWDGVALTATDFDRGLCILAGEECIWNLGDDHKMHYPQLPDEAGWDVMATYPMVLADDFECAETGWIKDFHWWGSWRDDYYGQILYFVLSIHEDIPADQNPDGYSKPGPELWVMEIPIDQINVIGIDPPTMEGWYDPSTGEVLPDNHQSYFQYNLCLDEVLWFPQDSGVIYWLNITAFVEDPGTQWGWKSTLDHWNDDAVWAYYGEFDWKEIYEPGSGPLNPITNQFFVVIDETGNLIQGYSEDAYDDGASNFGWYYYEWYDWWNIWFYDHQYAPTRYKTIHVEFDIFRWSSTAPSMVEIAVNWSTDAWSIDQPAGDSAPPLPGVDEDLYIGRYIGFQSDLDSLPPGHYSFDYTIPDYNPEWVSIDIRGFNFAIEPGWITHECIGQQQQSLDLAFVITGDPPVADSGACCYPEPTGSGDWLCLYTTEEECLVNLGGVWEGAGVECLGIEACCLPNGDCVNADALCCVNELGGIPQGAGSVCTQPEACCIPGAPCQMLDRLCCIDLGGTPQGPGSQCTATQACCFPDGTCSDLDPLCCAQLGGTPQGAGTACTAAQEACCIPGADCQMMDPLCCLDLGGTPQGPGSQCTNVEGCCMSNGTCTNLDPLCCVQLGGVPQGAGTNCTVPAACCITGPAAGCIMVDPLCCDEMGGTPSPWGAPQCMGDGNGNGIDDACEMPEDFKWYQPPDLEPTGMDVMASDYLILADDFECNRTGPITEIHVWGSWLYDEMPNYDPMMVDFTLSIHDDIPFGPLGWSVPGELLCLMNFPAGNFEVIPYAFGLQEGWYDPEMGWYLPLGDTQCWEYVFFLSDECYQFGTDTDPVVYWLNVHAMPLNEPGQNAQFGWKTSREHWNDDAVWGFPPDPLPPDGWFELRYPTGHPYADSSIDLAFAIHGPAVCDAVIGDADGSGGPNPIDIDDAVYLIAYIFSGGPPPIPYPIASGDADCSCGVDIDDVVYLIAYIFSGGPPPCTCEQWVALCGPLQ